MTKHELIKQCRYYKGEDECPFGVDDGRSVWWKIERYGVGAGDKTDRGLSPTMISYIRERIWQSDSGWTTNWETALNRARELYDKGKWNAGYISDKKADIFIVF